MAQSGQRMCDDVSVSFNADASLTAERHINYCDDESGCFCAQAEYNIRNSHASQAAINLVSGARPELCASGEARASPPNTLCSGSRERDCRWESR